MERNNTLILDLSESANDVEVWAKILQVWEMKTSPDEIERHLIMSDPNVSCRIEITVPNSLINKHYFGYFDKNQWRKTQCLYLFLSNKFSKGVSTTPIQLGWVTSFGTLIEFEDDPYEEMFDVPLTQINFKLMNESGCELEFEALRKLAQELDMKSWMLSKYQKTFLALRFWRVQYLEKGRVRITDGGPCSKFEFDPTWI
ncbi:hypothetical protein Bca101_010176 [Brassica carinata]